MRTRILLSILLPLCSAAPLDIAHEDTKVDTNAPHDRTHSREWSNSDAHARVQKSISVSQIHMGDINVGSYAGDEMSISIGHQLEIGAHGHTGHAHADHTHEYKGHGPDPHVHDTANDGGWSNWGDYGECSKECGGGHQTRTRTCKKVKGLTCEQQNIGEPTETRDCNLHNCDVDGGWSVWTEYGGCSATCGDGTQVKTRTCTNPEPRNNGLTCEQQKIGDARETRDCNLHDCEPIDCKLSGWSDWSACTVSCGGGIRTRLTNILVKESNGGKPCKTTEEEEECFMDKCPDVDGGWSVWTEYGGCSATCGDGTQVKTRTCTNPEPRNNGLTCEQQKIIDPSFGDARKTRDCNLQDCDNELEFPCEFDDNLLSPQVDSEGQLSPHDKSHLFKWKNNIIPYYYGNDQIKDEDKDLIRSVMDRFEEETCFKFVEQNKDENGNEHSLKIYIENRSCRGGVSGYVKQVSYKNKLELKFTTHVTDKYGEDCGSRGLITHELMHVLGVGHTQRRKDRDSFIEVKLENLVGVSQIIRDQYEKCESCEIYDRIPYSCGSIMHYGTHLYRKELIVPKDKETCKLERGNLLYRVMDAPAKDWEMLNIIGNCPGKEITSPNYPNNYPHNANTEQMLTVPWGYNIFVEFKDFDVENHASCNYDYLQLCHQNKICERKLCGTSLPANTIFPASTAIVKFVSDWSESRKGFRLTYQKKLPESSNVQAAVNINYAVEMDKIGYLFQGYDILKGNPLPLNAVPVDPGYRQPIFEASYQSRTKTADRRYLQPDGTNIASCSGDCSLKFRTTEISGAKSYQDILGKKVRLSLGTWGGKFSASEGYKEVAEKTSSHLNLFTLSLASCCSYSAEILTYSPPSLSKNFRSAVETLTEKYDDGIYLKFIKTFGTHFISQAHMGALYAQQSEISKEAWTTMQDNGIEISTAAELSAYLSTGSTSFESSDNENKAKDFSSKTKDQKTIIIGVKPPADGKTGTWLKRIKFDPAPIKLTLGSLVDIFEHDDVKDKITTAVKDNMKKALDDYCLALHESGEVSTCSSVGKHGWLTGISKDNTLVGQDGEGLIQKVPGVAGDRLLKGQKLLGEEFLRSQNGEYDLVMQSDGNLVIYENFNDGRTPTYSTGTSSGAGSYLVLQEEDGNLVIYTTDGTVLWATNTPSADSLVMQNDGNLVLYAADNALWASNDASFFDLWG